LIALLNDGLLRRNLPLDLPSDLSLHLHRTRTHRLDCIAFPLLPADRYRPTSSHRPYRCSVLTATCEEHRSNRWNTFGYSESGLVVEVIQSVIGTGRTCPPRLPPRLLPLLGRFSGGLGVFGRCLQPFRLWRVAAWVTRYTGSNIDSRVRPVFNSAFWVAVQYRGNDSALQIQTTGSIPSLATGNATRVSQFCRKCIRELFLHRAQLHGRPACNG
jgi:hypothetical protein